MWCILSMRMARKWVVVAIALAFIAGVFVGTLTRVADYRAFDESGSVDLETYVDRLGEKFLSEYVKRQLQESVPATSLNKLNNFNQPKFTNFFIPHARAQLGSSLPRVGETLPACYLPDGSEILSQVLEEEDEQLEIFCVKYELDGTINSELYDAEPIYNEQYFRDNGFNHLIGATEFWVGSWDFTVTVERFNPDNDCNSTVRYSKRFKGSGIFMFGNETIERLEESIDRIKSLFNLELLCQSNKTLDSSSGLLIKNRCSYCN